MKVLRTNAQHHMPPHLPRQAFQGGPLINSKGDVVAVASRAYAPLGFTSDGVYFSVPIRSSCDRVLRCPSGEPNAPGQQQH